LGPGTSHVELHMNKKERKFLIATHGALADGFRSSLEIIAGAADSVCILQAYLDDNKPIEEKLAELFHSAGDPGDPGDSRDPGDPGDSRDPGDQEEWVVFSDLLGGSITNQLMRAGAGKNVHIIAGFNLPLLLEVVLADPEIPVEELLLSAIERARAQMVYVNSFILQHDNTGDNA